MKRCLKCSHLVVKSWFFFGNYSHVLYRKGKLIYHAFYLLGSKPFQECYCPDSDIEVL